MNRTVSTTTSWKQYTTRKRKQMQKSNHAHTRVQERNSKEGEIKHQKEAKITDWGKQQGHSNAKMQSYDNFHTSDKFRTNICTAEKTKETKHSTAPRTYCMSKHLASTRTEGKQIDPEHGTAFWKTWIWPCNSVRPKIWPHKYKFWLSWPSTNTTYNAFLNSCQQSLQLIDYFGIGDLCHTIAWIKMSMFKETLSQSNIVLGFALRAAKWKYNLFWP